MKQSKSKDFGRSASDRRTLMVSRRAMLAGMSGLVAMQALPGLSFAAESHAGGVLSVVAWPAPQMLTSAISTSGPEVFVAGKIFDGLLTYDLDMKPQPCLAESWEVSPDGLRAAFRLRDGVKWHDGQPMTSKDVAFSMMSFWRELHGRGRVTFADVTEVETPDPLTAIIVLKRPSPTMFKALFASESPVMPAHLYEGTDLQNNPHNVAPIGTGPFKFVSYERGSNVILERNPDYWDADFPHLDRLVIRYVPEAATRSAMLESNDAQLTPSSLLPAPDIQRFMQSDDMVVEPRGYAAVSQMHFIDFNLDNPILSDVRVRQALTHAVDRDWITKNIWYGFGKPGTGPIHYLQADAYTTDGVPVYEPDLAKANALLDEAGHPRGNGGTRFELTIVPTAYGEEAARSCEYMREQYRQIGVKLNIKVLDYASYIREVYTERKFDINNVVASATADPTLGVQRFYWSKAFKPGVGFSNASHYANPEVDSLLESAQVEMDPAKRRELFAEFQRKVMADVPSVVLTFMDLYTVARKEVVDHTVDGLGALGNLSRTRIEE